MNAVEEFPFASRSPKDVAWESKMLLNSTNNFILQVAKVYIWNKLKK